MQTRQLLAAISLSVAVLSQALAFDGIVEKKSLTLPSYTTLGGKTLKQVKVGFETYGKMNAAGDNVILICHYFSGSSHAAGKYKADDAKPGYWDSLVGSGKAFDTDKYFVVSADILANLNKDTLKYTTGPASINPDTGKPYAADFPVVTIRDFVNVQHAVLQSLGVKKLVAVAGPSLGSMQSLEWAAAYPDMVERVIAVIPAGIEVEALTIARLGLWSQAIRLDPQWKGGNYYGKGEPLDGLREASKQAILDIQHWDGIPAAFGRSWSLNDPIYALDNAYSFEDALNNLGTATARNVDANAFLAVVKSAQLFRVGHGATLEEGVKKIKAKVMIMPAATDLLFFPAFGKRAADTLRQHGVSVEYSEIAGKGGHMDGLQIIAQEEGRIKAFLAK